jgi:hypothetical protein
MEIIEPQISETNLIYKLVDETLESKLTVYNSISGVLARFLSSVDKKIPSGAEMQKIIKMIPKELSKISPDTINAFKGIDKLKS